VIGALQLDRSRRDGRNERFLEALAGQRGLEVGDIGLDGRLAAISDGRADALAKSSGTRSAFGKRAKSPPTPTLKSWPRCDRLSIVLPSSASQ
jgi:hypothetical protein